MWKIVKNVIEKCDIYIWNKVSRYIFYRLMKFFDIFFYVWKLIALNFIIKLFLFTNLIIEIKYNVIIVIINKFIKYIYFILWKITIMVKDVIYKILKVIIVNYDMFNKIILNKNKIFIFKV